MISTERGTRSAHDAQAWTCDGCGTCNEPQQCLIFDIPTFKCSEPTCGRKFIGDFDFCLGDIRVNGQLLVQDVLYQTPDACLPTAICQALHMMHVLDSVLKEQEIDEEKVNLNPTYLLEQYRDLFPPTLDIHQDFVYPHMFVNMALILKNEGIRLDGNGFYKIGDVCAIPGDDFEAICKELAEGNPLITSFHPGAHFFMGLGYCQVYRAPLLTEVMIEQKDNGNPVDAHMVVLIGAFSRGTIRGFYFLNSHGEAFCARSINEEQEEGRPHPVSGGIGKIEEKFSYTNAIKFLREGEAAGDEFVRLGVETVPNTVSIANCTLLFGDLIPRLLDSELDEVLERRQAEEQRLTEEEEQRLREEEEERQAQQLGQLEM